MSRSSRCAVFSPQNHPDSEKHGFSNLAYEYGSQSELCPPPRTACSATFRLQALDPQQQQQVGSVHSRLSGLNGVLAASCPTPAGYLTVEYDVAVVTPREVALELQDMGFSAECAVRIRVDGMRCQSCVQSIEGLVGSLEGISHIQVSLQDGAVLAVHRPLVVTQQELRDRIEDMGFSATLLCDDPPGPDLRYWQDLSTQTVTIWIVGMTCNSCVQSIEGRVGQMSGVWSISVSLKEEKGTVTFDPSLTGPEQLRATVEDMGFDASLTGRHHPPTTNPTHTARALVCFTFTGAASSPS